MRHYINPNPQYDYVVKRTNHAILERLLTSTLETLEENLGTPSMFDVPGPARWVDVLARDLHPEVPLTVWRDRVQVIFPIPFDFIRKAEGYLHGEGRPDWLVLSKDAQIQMPEQAVDEGLDYLRYLTNRDLPDEDDD